MCSKLLRLQRAELGWLHTLGFCGRREAAETELLLSFDSHQIQSHSQYGNKMANSVANVQHNQAFSQESASTSEIQPLDTGAARIGGQGVVGVSSFRGELCAVKTIPKRRTSAISAEIATVSCL